MTKSDPDEIESEEEEYELEWLLGFVEHPEQPTDLLRHRFPSKVGGRPAWLDPVDLPTREQLTCAASGRPMVFLLQVYAPLDDNPQAFHRTMYLFMSPQGDKLAQPGAVRALRCQLPRANPHYGFAPAPATQLAPPQLPPPAAARAAAADPWRAAEAEQAAAAAARGARSGATGSGAVAAGGTAAAAAAAAADGPVSHGLQGIWVLPELELVVDPEPEEEELEEEESGGRQQAEVRSALAAYRARVAAEGEYDDQELPPELMEALEIGGGGEEAQGRRCFAAFQARVGRAPEQVLRYCFQPGAQPLLPSPSPPLPAGAPPACSHCGGPRRFEFQVMPQLLSFLQLDEEDPEAPDWGVISVFSCAASCAPQPGGVGAGSAYVEEFVWVQPSA